MREPGEEAKGSQVVVAGAGMAGLVAAVRAQELGARVILLEKGDAIGGSMVLSGGTLWTVDTLADLRRLVPLGDPELGHALIEGFGDGVKWLKGLGATLTPLPSQPYREVSRSIYFMDPGASPFAFHMLARFESLGGSLMLNTSAAKVNLDASGAVTGLVVRTPNGQREISAGAVILATGGFQGNPDLMARYFGRWSDRFILRANPWSTGDGLLVGTAVGAATSKGMSSFYGHSLTAPPAKIPPDDFLAYTQNHSEWSILVNLRGERFVDESLGDEVTVQAVAREPEALAFMVFDQPIYRDYAVLPPGPGTRGGDKFIRSRSAGGKTAVALTIEDLAEEMSAWGVHAEGVVSTVHEYNRAVESQSASRLRIPRRGNVNPIATPPFLALAVTPGVTFTMGGLKINSDAQVLDSSGRPIQGLYAAGADAGGIFNENYAGGLSLGLVFGRRAAQHAVAAL